MPNTHTPQRPLIPAHRATILAAAILVVAALAAGTAIPAATATPPPGAVSTPAGFAATPLAAVAGPTAIAFGPGDADGPDLYATTLTGDVARVHLAWTPVGPVATNTTTHATGFGLALGLAFGPDDALYVSDSHPGAESGGTDGRVTRVDADGTRTVVVDGLPNDRHNTNHLRFGPDGRLHITNGNPNDNGVDGGAADVFPYSGAILNVNAAEVTASPAVLHWLDGAGDPIAPDDIASHAVNDDFADKVNVTGYGFRNVFGVAFGPDGAAYTAMNGADDPSSQDALYRVTPGADHGFPFCYNEGPAGGVGDDVRVENNPLFPAHDCSTVPPATALLGWHTCTTGIDFPTDGPAAFPAGMQGDVFVAECAVFFANDWAEKVAEDPANATHSTSHKVVRVHLDEDGEATQVEDFLTGLALPTDVRFGPDGAMYVADVEGILRVAPAVPATTSPATTAETGTTSDQLSVSIKAAGFRFEPSTITVPAGTTVEWDGVLLHHTVTTNDGATHALEADGNDEQNSDDHNHTFSHRLGQGSTVTHTFTEPGIYWYHCEPHGRLGMVGVVIVV